MSTQDQDATRTEAAIPVDKAEWHALEMQRFQSNLPHTLKKLMRQQLITMHSIMLAHPGVDRLQFDTLREQCLHNDDDTVGENFTAIAPQIGVNQRDARVHRAEVNLARCKREGQGSIEIMERKLEEAKASPAIPSICPSLAVLVKSIDAKAVVVMSNNSGEEMVSHTGARLARELMEKYPRLPVPTLKQWRAMGLFQYREFKIVFEADHKRVKPINKKRIRRWLEGHMPSAPIDGVAFWKGYAVACGYVDEDGNPLPFDERFHVDHVLCRCDLRASSESDMTAELDHPDNYSIHWKEINEDDLFKVAKHDFCPLKAYIQGPVGTALIKDSKRHRSTVLYRNAVHCRKVLGDSADALAHLSPFDPSMKASYDKQIRQLVGMQPASRSSTKTKGPMDAFVSSDNTSPPSPGARRPPSGSPGASSSETQHDSNASGEDGPSEHGGNTTEEDDDDVSDKAKGKRKQAASAVDNFEAEEATANGKKAKQAADDGPPPGKEGYRRCTGASGRPGCGKWTIPPSKIKNGEFECRTCKAAANVLNSGGAPPRDCDLGYPLCKDTKHPERNGRAKRGANIRGTLEGNENARYCSQSCCTKHEALIRRGEASFVPPPSKKKSPTAGA